MKKAVAVVILAGIVMRLAVLAGAGEALGAWVRDIGVDGRVVTAALSLELGGGLPEAVELNAEGASIATVETEPAETPEPETPAAAQETAAPSPRQEDAAKQHGEDAPPKETATVTTLAPAMGGSTIHNRTQITVDTDALAAEGLSLRLPAGQPQILIIHTHSSEAYSQDPYDPYEPSDPYRTEDKRYSVIRVGDVLAEQFEACGLTVLHDRELYDYPSYTGSYNRSGAAVEQYLAEYPSIRIVIDLHRDAIGSGDVIYKTQATLDGRTSAQTMLLVGTGENGLWHPYWQENLKLALYMQSALDERYPTLARPIELVSERYNQQLSAGSLLLEVGSSGNTLSEALLAAELFGNVAGSALAELIETE